MYTYNQIVVDIINTFGQKSVPIGEIARPYLNTSFNVLLSSFIDKMGAEVFKRRGLTPMEFIKDFSIPSVDVSPQVILDGITEGLGNYAIVYTASALPSPLMADEYTFRGIYYEVLGLETVKTFVGEYKDAIVVFGDPFRPPQWFRYEYLYRDDSSFKQTHLH